ncbi:MAG: TonB-dependent receptor [Acidobacteriota bacterium]|jgi:vitamin B12 transporter
MPLRRRPAPVAIAPALLTVVTLLTVPAARASADPREPSDETPADLRLEEEIVVTADRIPEPAQEAGSSVTVLDREEIERRQVTTVLELLRTVPGLEASQTGGPGRTASVFLRGASSGHTLVLLDGVRLNSPAVGSFDFADLTLDNVERIEILRGPQSVLYGSEAIGGVVSITTRAGGEGFAADAATEAGSLGLTAVRGSVRGGGDRFAYSVTAARREMDGVSTASERRGNTEDDPWENTTVSGRLGATFLGDGRATLTARRVDSETGLDGFTFGVGPTDDPNYVQTRELTQTSVELSKPITPSWRQELTVGTVEEDLVAEDPDTPFHNFEVRTRVSEVSTRSDLRLGSSNRLLAGATFERREAENPGAFDETIDLSSVFTNHRWSWRDRLFLTAGLRHDDYSDFGAETTYRTTASLRFPGRGTRLHGSFGTGFRVPTFNELFFPQAGNPDLEPESSEGWDLGVERFFLDGRLRLDLTGFGNELDELILFDSTTFTFQNVARAESRGVELTAEADPAPGWSLAAAYTWNETEDRATGEPLARRPEHRGSLQVTTRPTGRLRLSATVLAVADRIDSDGAPMDDYERLDLAGELRLGEHVRPYARVDNLLDEDYEEVNGFTTPGRTFVVGLRAEL